MVGQGVEYLAGAPGAVGPASGCGIIGTMKTPAQPRRQPRRPSSAAGTTSAAIDLALQGGGSHGAFTWGALERLLEDETLSLDGISGSSAGALNAAVLATGYADGGRAGARDALRAFWLDVASCGGGCFGGVPVPPTVALGAWPMPGLAGFNLDANPMYAWFNQFVRSFSPYQFNPYDLNLLRELTQRHVREPAMQKGPLALFVTATAVRTGQPRIFSGTELTIDALMASACLPQLFRSVMIDGEPYWDGGYSGNPALWPLIYNTEPLDILLVKINPLVRPELPDTPTEIADRVNEITFNAGLVSEMRAPSLSCAGWSNRAASMPANSRPCDCTWWPTKKGWHPCIRRASSIPSDPSSRPCTTSATPPPSVG